MANRLSLRSRGTCPPILRSSTLPRRAFAERQQPGGLHLATAASRCRHDLCRADISRWPAKMEGYGGPPPASRNMTDTVASHLFRFIAARSLDQGRVVILDVADAGAHQQAHHLSRQPTTKVRHAALYLQKSYNKNFRPCNPYQGHPQRDLMVGGRRTVF
jgi:hypothetical protein